MATQTVSGDSGSTFNALQSLWPYMWPPDRRDLKLRLVWATVLLFIAKGVLVLVPYFFKWATDALAGDARSTPPLPDFLLAPVMLVIAYNVMRLVQLGFNQLRDALFARVGQHAVRQLAYRTFVHMHELSLRFHLERRTGGLSRIIERGTKGIETIVRYTMLAMAPTVLEFALTAGIFAFAYGWTYVAVIAVTVWLYVWFTVKISDWRINIRREMNDSDTDANTKAIELALELRNGEVLQQRDDGGRALRPLDGALRKGRHHDLGVDRLAELRPGRHLRRRHDRHHVAVRARGHGRHADSRRLRLRQRHADATGPAAQLHRHDLSRDTPGPDRYREHVRPAQHQARSGRQAGRPASRGIGGQCRVPRCAFCLRSRAPDPEGRQLRGAFRQDRRHCRPFGRRQVDRVAAAFPFLRHPVGKNTDRRAAISGT